MRACLLCVRARGLLVVVLFRVCLCLVFGGAALPRCPLPVEFARVWSLTAKKNRTHTARRVALASAQVPATSGVAALVFAGDVQKDMLGKGGVVVVRDLSGDFDGPDVGANYFFFFMSFAL